MGLLYFSDEVLEIVMKALLPPFRSQSLAETYVFTVPVDLLAARLVCRRFHRIATPLAWRRVQLQIASPSPRSYGIIRKTDEPALLTANEDSLRSLVRSRFFHENAHLAAYVRELLVSIEWHAEHPERARDALRAATRAMSGLRSLLVWDTGVLPFEDIRALFQRPLLRTVRLMDVDGSAFPASGGWGAGLKMLHIANSVCPARLVAGASSSLECLTIELARTCPDSHNSPTLRDIPWTALKEVALVDCVNEGEWLFFLEVFEIHKRLSRPTALGELIIGDIGGLEPGRVSALLRTFDKQPLRRLSLYFVFSLDPSILAAIVSAFPTLSELTLLTEGGFVAWPGSLDAYARMLTGLPNLVCLAWNNFSLDPEMDFMFPLLNASELGNLYAEDAWALARRVRTLRRLRFTSITESIVDTVRVGPWAEFEPVDVTRSIGSVLCTSSWNTSSGAFEDI